MFDSGDFLTCLSDAWERGLPIIHNWTRTNLLPEALSIREWCDERGIPWGAPQGFPVQDAQRSCCARGTAVLWRVPGPGRYGRVMFSFSESANAEAYAAAANVAERLGGHEE